MRRNEARYPAKPAGEVRLNTDEFAPATLLWPRLRKALVAFPDIMVEVVTDYGLTDIVAGRFASFVGLAGLVDRDKIAVPTGPDEPMVVVGSPPYVSGRPPPLLPGGLTDRNYSGLRLQTHGGFDAREFEKDERELRVRLEGQVAFTTNPPRLAAAPDGFGLAYLPRGMAEPHLAARGLAEALGDWLAPLAGYHPYYPSRR